MRSHVFKAAFLSLLLAGCSDVTPQVSLLRKIPGPAQNTVQSPPVETELASVGVSTSTDGYHLKAVVSKENKAVPSISANGYKLVLDTQAE
ncbi:hypothetical protein [Bdellovibrio sp. BCCA]|uniref:hypothetical protein n=1 Tax=Bdellovibrio sp. BCCA TaxID=3136281 RepID=UPI0030F0640F